MSLTNVAMIGILLAFVLLLVGFLMDGPEVEMDNVLEKKPVVKKPRKRPVRSHPRRKAA